MRAVFLVLGAVLAFGLLAVAEDGSVEWPGTVADRVASCTTCTMSLQSSPPRDWWCWYVSRCGVDLTWWYICCYAEHCVRFIILPVIGPICLEWRTLYTCGCFPSWAIPYSAGEMVR